MPPLAGRPPYATDEPDSVFQVAPLQPQKRMRQPPPDDPNKRTSAYDMYDDYIKGKGAPDKNPFTLTSNARNSGIGNLLLNMGDDSDDDSDGEDDFSRRANLNKNASVSSLSSPSKNVAVTASVNPIMSGPPRTVPPQVPPPPRQQAHHPPPPLSQQHQHPALRTAGPPSPRPIAAPRPGYALAAPIAALNGQAASPSPPLASPVSGSQNPFLTPQQPSHLRGPPSPLFIRPSVSPSPSPATPHPLHPPITPITPAFIRPSTTSPCPIPRSFSGSTLVSSNGRSEPSVKFSLDKKPAPIMRGNTEETLLPSRGEKGDDFWRRFSIVAKEPASTSESSWLKKTRSGSSRMSRFVWIVALFLVIAIIGGIVVGVWLSRSSPNHQQPKAIGGSDDHFATTTTTSSLPVMTTGVVAASSSSKHVSPTVTIK